MRLAMDLDESIHIGPSHVLVRCILYNEWPDMDAFIKIHGESHIFIGSRPKTAGESLNRLEYNEVMQESQLLDVIPLGDKLLAHILHSNIEVE
jgi:hypothetical protein